MGFVGRSSARVLALFLIAFLAQVSDAAAMRNVFLISDGPGATNTAANTRFEGSSADGQRMFFRSNEGLTPGDNDNHADIFERNASGVSLVTPPPVPGIPPPPCCGSVSQPVFYAANSSDGSRVFFVTSERLVTQDTDLVNDVYSASGGVATLLSDGTAGDGGNGAAGFAGATPDGSHVFIQTTGKLLPADTDSMSDVYDYTGGSLSLVTPDPGVSNNVYAGSSDDGSVVVFSSYDPLAAGDTDGDKRDLYVRAGGVTSLVSGGPSGGSGAPEPVYIGMSDDGSKIIFTTTEALTPDDTGDTTGQLNDLYMSSASGTELVSQVPSGSAVWAHNQRPSTIGIGPVPSAVITADGSKVFFTACVGSGACDVYERSGGVTTALTASLSTHNNYLSKATPDGAHVYYASAGDNRWREYTSGTTNVILNSANARLVKVTSDGRRLFFWSGFHETPDDTDSTGACPQLVSLGNLGFAGTYPCMDVFERLDGQLRLVSAPPGGSGATFHAEYKGASQDGARVFFDTAEQLVGWDTDNVTDSYGSLDTDAYVSPKAATPFYAPLVPAYDTCASPNRVHGGALSYTSCNPPSLISDGLEWGTYDSNGALARGTGSVRLRAVATPATDMSIEAAVTDVRCRVPAASCGSANDVAGADYAGELRGVLPIRLTDRASGPSADEPATTVDNELGFTLACIETASTQAGSDCAAATSLEALAPGAAVAGRRSIVALDRIRIEDGGPDGLAGTTPNEPFLRQGVFVP